MAEPNPTAQPRDPAPPETATEAAMRQVFAPIFDAAWYVSRYPDVSRGGLDPLRHFIVHGATEKRDPNRWFDSAWYTERYEDVRMTGVNPLLHYLQSGAANLRDPHPSFDSTWYVDQHPEARGNPLLFHVQIGAKRGYPTEKSIRVTDYLPSEAAALPAPANVSVDVIIPVYKGFDATKRCLTSVLADTNRMAGRVIVVDDASPEPKISAWLDTLAARGDIVLVRNKKNLGFVASVNHAMRLTAPSDAVLLNSDTEVPVGWLPRLAAQAYRADNIASVSPFSNNATICSYPQNDGSALPFGRSLAEIDATCQRVNAGRWVDLPTTVGFCMYIRRTAWDAVGPFDVAAFGRGYGEENDFCQRALALGWRHSLACDVFVYHEGAVSFGDEANIRGRDVIATLLARYPNYMEDVARHIRLDDVGSYRIAVTASLFAASDLPVILMVCHGLGGGARVHVDRLIESLVGRAHCLLLSSSTRGAELSVPEVPGHAKLRLTKYRLDDLIRILRSANVGRVHIHHISDMDTDVRTLIDRLGVGFDLTVHDYFAICPQVTMLPWLDGAFCGEPGPGGCNACIADRPSYGASEIIAWRHRHAWMFREADHVLCPSADVEARLRRYGVAEHAIVAPHEPVAPGNWVVRPPKLGRGPLRVALVGTLALHKGAAIASAVSHAADPRRFAFHLIGDIETNVPPAIRDQLVVTGRYNDAELQTIIRSIRPHVLWFPSSGPETYSYAISAAIDSELPIVASNLGAFPERLAGRPQTWLVDPGLDPEPWLAAFEAVRTALAAPPPPTAARPGVADYYADSYLALPAIRGSGPIDLRRPNRTSVVVVPERFDNRAVTPCAYIRLLLPLDHAAGACDLDVVVEDAESALRYRADVIATQRYPADDTATVDALARHAKATGARLYYDLDDDLLNIPKSHPDAPVLRPRAKIVQRMLRHADRLLVSTPALADSLRGVRDDVVVVPNALDERLWGSSAPPRSAEPHQGPVRILCMGTSTHDDDFAMIEPALARLAADFGGRMQLEMLGFSGRKWMPSWVRRLSPTPAAGASYPGFVNWIRDQRPWDIGLAPLRQSAFNRCKSAIKTLDYAALGLAVLASDVPVYQGSLADGAGGMLVGETEDDWYQALARLIRDTALRRELAHGAWSAYAERGTLGAAMSDWRARWFGGFAGAE